MVANNVVDSSLLEGVGGGRVAETLLSPSLVGVVLVDTIICAVNYGHGVRKDKFPLNFGITVGYTVITMVHDMLSRIWGAISAK